MQNKDEKVVKILVSGDVVVDNHIYMGDRKSPDAQGRGTFSTHEWGGAKLAEGILKEFAKLGGAAFPKMDVAFGLRLQSRPCFYSKEKGNLGPDTCPDLHCYATWSPMPSVSKNPVWRVNDAIGYGGAEGAFYDFAPLRNDPPWRPDVIVLEDAALGFRFKLDGNAQNGEEYKQNRGKNMHCAWPRALEEGTSGLPGWVVLKMARPLGRGDLWTALTKSAIKKKLVVIVSVNDIRRCSVQISHGCSWERTATDLVREFQQNPVLLPLLECRHLIIPLHSEGALWIENASSQKRVFHLVLDPRHQEQEWLDSEYPGKLLGYMSCLTASLAAHLAGNGRRPSDNGMLERGIRQGLGAMRMLFNTGHGLVKNPSPGFPYKEVAEFIAFGSESEYDSIIVPPQIALDLNECEQWNILADTEFHKMKLRWPLVGIARRVARFGPNELQGAPHARYGNFLTADRSEIEALQNLRRIMSQYINDGRQKSPLNIAVFGPPGAGKSFAVKQLAKKIIDRNVDTLTFNLSQFAAQEDLIDALHQVRDAVLKGGVPLIFWDEFDANDLLWLKSFLAPMQDGEFTDGQCTHFIGRCIFVFAGGTRESMEAFVVRDGTIINSSGKTEAQIFREKKGTDFVSRLSGYLNVRGPNPQSMLSPSGLVQDDYCYPVRRATMLRGMLKLKDAEELKIDRDILTAILATRKYINGSRSLEKLLTALASGTKGPISPSNLPPRDMLSILVEDVDDFMGYLQQSASFSRIAATLAPKIHETYRKDLRKAKMPIKWDLPFHALPEHIQQDNIAAAERIIDLLALVGLTVVPATPANKKKQVAPDIVDSLLARHAATLAQQEHDGWLAEKRVAGYQYDANRNEITRRHDLMKPYEDLPAGDKTKDLNSVLEIPARVREANHVIVPLAHLQKP